MVPIEIRHALWEALAKVYTEEEECDTLEALYRRLNRAIREDSPELWRWAAFIAAVLFGGYHLKLESYISNILAPVHARPMTKRNIYRGFGLDPEMATKYIAGKSFFWQA